MIGLLRHLGDREHRARHPERLEEPFPHELLPALAREELDHVAHPRVHHVVVEELRADRLGRLEVLEPLEQLAPGELGLVPDQVVPRDAGAMREHVADRHRAVELVVVELDARHELPDRLVPVELAFLHEQARGHRREQLRVRSDGHDRVLGERQLAPVVAIAVALGEHELVVDHDPHPDSGNVPVPDELLHRRVEALELLRRGVEGAGQAREAAETRHEEQGHAPRGPYRVRQEGETHRILHSRWGSLGRACPAGPRDRVRREKRS